MGSPTAIWDLYRTFLAVAQEGSFTGAARRLQMTQPTVGRQIKSLESMLAASLFIRSSRGLTPTEAGLDLVPHAEAMAAAAAAALRQSSADAASASGTVRLAAGELVGVEVLPPWDRRAALWRPLRAEEHAELLPVEVQDNRGGESALPRGSLRPLRRRRTRFRSGGRRPAA